MPKSGRIEFISRIRKALGYSSGDQQRILNLFDIPMSEEDRAVLKRVKNRTPQEKEKLFAMANEDLRVAADGGVSVEDISQELEGKNWAKFIKTFLKT